MTFTLSSEYNGTIQSRGRLWRFVLSESHLLVAAGYERADWYHDSQFREFNSSEFLIEGAYHEAFFPQAEALRPPVVSGQAVHYSVYTTAPATTFGALGNVLELRGLPIRLIHDSGEQMPVPGCRPLHLFAELGPIESRLTVVVPGTSCGPQG